MNLEKKTNIDMKNYKKFFSLLVIFLFVFQFSSNSQTIYPFLYWYKIYNAPSNLQDSAVAMAKNSLGQIFVAGYSLRTLADADLEVLRYNPDNGDTVWVKRYVGTGQNRISSMTCDNNAVYVTGWAFTGLNRDVITIKFSAATGDTLWVRKYNGPGGGGDYGHAIDIDAGFVYVTGRTDVGGAQKYLIIKYNINTGDTSWTYKYTGGFSTSADESHSIKVDGSGNIYVTGKRNFNVAGDILTLKISSAGTLLWEKVQNSPLGFDDNGVALALDNGAANVFVTGYSTRIDDQDYVTIKYNASTGDSLAFASYDGVSSDIPIGLVIDGSNNVYISGYSLNASSKYEFATIKYNSNLVQQWIKRIPNSSAANDVPNNITLGTNNDIYVTGTSWGGVTQYDYFTVRYNASTGDTIWTKRENGTANRNDFASAVVVLDTSRVFVTGSAVFSPATTASFYTLRYSNQILGIKPISTEIPVTFAVHQNYPNPFNPVTSIRFDVPKESIVEVTIYDVMGQVVELLGKEKLNPGKYEVKWDASKYSSGLYFYKVRADEFSQVKKMILVK